LPWLDVNLGDLARGRAGNLHRRLAGFQLDDPLVLGDDVAFLDEQFENVAGIDALAEIRKLDFDRHMGQFKVPGSKFKVDEARC
jgi:hypothetical protein